MMHSLFPLTWTEIERSSFPQYLKFPVNFPRTYLKCSTSSTAIITTSLNQNELHILTSFCKLKDLVVVTHLHVKQRYKLLNNFEVVSVSMDSDVFNGLRMSSMFLLVSWQEILRKFSKNMQLIDKNHLQLESFIVFWRPSVALCLGSMFSLLVT